jgi:hypothetical protein
VGDVCGKAFALSIEWAGKWKRQLRLKRDVCDEMGCDTIIMFTHIYLQKGAWEIFHGSEPQAADKPSTTVWPHVERLASSPSSSSFSSQKLHMYSTWVHVCSAPLNE